MVWQSQLLEGRHVRLEPLTSDHMEPLWTVAQDPAIWRYMPFQANSFEAFAGYLQRLLTQQSAGEALPFATYHKDTAAYVGSTSYLAIDPYNKRLEIGATWITPARQRSATNTEAKLLQLTDAFERLACNRVEFKTDSLNERSRAALLRIGATQEGTFRNHMIMPDGRIRHSVYFSVTREEWPDVKRRLQAKLD